MLKTHSEKKKKNDWKKEVNKKSIRKNTNTRRREQSGSGEKRKCIVYTHVEYV